MPVGSIFQGNNLKIDFSRFEKSMTFVGRQLLLNQFASDLPIDWLKKYNDMRNEEYYRIFELTGAPSDYWFRWKMNEVPPASIAYPDLKISECDVPEFIGDYWFVGWTDEDRVVYSNYNDSYIFDDGRRDVWYISRDNPMQVPWADLDYWELSGVSIGQQTATSKDGTTIIEITFAETGGEHQDKTIELNNPQNIYPDGTQFIGDYDGSKLVVYDSGVGDSCVQNANINGISCIKFLPERVRNWTVYAWRYGDIIQNGYTIPIPESLRQSITLSVWASFDGTDMYCIDAITYDKNILNPPNNAYMVGGLEISGGKINMLGVQTDFSPNPGEIHLYTAVIASNSFIKIYVDGRERITADWIAPIVDIQLGFGVCSGSFIELQFKGCMADLRIYSRALSDREVAFIFMEGRESMANKPDYSDLATSIRPTSIPQYLKKIRCPIFAQIMNAIGDEFSELYNAGIEILRQRTINDATGYNLDIIGYIVGQQRLGAESKINVPWFAPDDVDGSIDKTGYDWRVDSANAYVTLGPTYTDILSLDPEYRRMILGKIFKNGMMGVSVPEIKVFLDTVFGANRATVIEVVESGERFMRIVLRGTADMDVARTLIKIWANKDVNQSCYMPLPPDVRLDREKCYVLSGSDMQLVNIE